MLRIYNTKSRSVEEFRPLNSEGVTMYACGPTVYDYTHVGHMRKYIGDDILRRVLEYTGHEVTHVMNITDVGHLTNDSDSGEDKFEKGAKREGKTVWDIAKFYTDHFHKSMRAVNVLPPSIECLATDHIAHMVSLVEKLMEQGYAYETSRAIYFNVQKDPAYGSFSGQTISEKSIAAREDVVVDVEKKHPADFVLWFKRTGRFENHTMHWPSPWGDGFPGWHIECSAMSMHYLGETIDIHTGGIDHIAVHHENEIAQSQCATGKQFVRYWVHHDFLQVDGEKMAKSKQNYYAIEDIISRNIDPLAMRILCMQTSYRKPLNFTWESLENAQQTLRKLQKFASKATDSGSVIQTYEDAFIEALQDDLNTAKALSVVFEVLQHPDHNVENKWMTLLRFDSVLGLNLASTPKFVIRDDALELMQKRDEARRKKDYATSDQLRTELEGLGYEVLDTPDGTKLD